MKARLCSILLLVLLFAGGLIQEVHAQSDRWPRPIVSDPTQDVRRELLLSHGINPEPGSLIHFLRNGFDLKSLPRGLPQLPQLKSEIVNAAIVELGITAAESAVPLLIEIAEQHPPKGVATIIARDFEDSPIEMVDQEVLTMTRLLSLNAVMALGLIGDERAAPTILHLIRTEPGSAFITNGAEALALMGHNDGLGALVLLAASNDANESAAAFRSIFIVTGRNYGLTENSSIAKRRQLLEQLRSWFEERGHKEPIFRSEVLRRQEVPVLPDSIDPRSLRGLLRGSSDLTNYDRRYEARQELFGLAPQRFDELEKIATDPLEDLDIRRAAMRWMTVSNARAARSIIRRLRKDENPSIGDMAGVIEQDIPRYLEEQRGKR